jgi:hypothetical protein
VRRGACWTAAYHLQLTVAAVARPVGSSVVPSESLLLSGPGLLLAQPASARRSVQPPSSGGASSPWSTLRRRQPWHRSVSSIGCSPIRGRRPGSGGPAVQCPARPVAGHLGSSSGCPAVRSSAVHPSGVRPLGVHPSGVRPLGVHPSGVRPLGVHPSSVQPAGVHPSGVQPSGVQPAAVRPVGPDPSVSSIPGGGVGPRSVRRASVTTGTGRVPVGYRAVERFGRRPSRPGRGRCCRARVLVSGGLGWRTRAGLGTASARAR